MVGGRPETLVKMDVSVRGHPKTSKKQDDFVTEDRASKLFYAVAFGRKIGVFVNKWADTENLTKHFKGARFRSFKAPQDAWQYILELNKDAPLPDSLLEYSKLSENEIEQFRNEML